MKSFKLSILGIVGSILAVTTIFAKDSYFSCDDNTQIWVANEPYDPVDLTLECTTFFHMTPLCEAAIPGLTPNQVYYPSLVDALNKTNQITLDVFICDFNTGLE